MARLEAGRKSNQYIIKSLVPDVCKTPPNGAPAPYNISIKLDGAILHSSDVNFKSEPAAISSLRCSPVKGDEAGTMGGMASGVNLGWCRPINFVETVQVNGLKALYHEDTFCFMNCAGRDGPYNTIGKLQCLDDMATGPAADPNKPMAGDPPISLTPAETEFMGGGPGLLSKMANTPGLGVDLAKMAYGVSQNGFSPEAILGGLGGIAGIAGLGGLAQVANLGLQAKALADTDWSNPAAVLGALGGMAGLGGAMSGSPQLTQLGKELGNVAMGAGAAQSMTSKPGAMMMGMNTITATRATAAHNPQVGQKLQAIAKQSIGYRTKAQLAKSAQSAQQMATTSLPKQFKTRLNQPAGGS